MDHFSFAFANARHIDFDVVFGNTELFASIEERSDFSAVDDVFNWETCDIRTRTPDVFALNDGDSLALISQSPSQESPSLAAP